MGGAAAAAVVCAALLCYVLWPATSGDPAWLWTHRGGSGSGGGGGSPGRPGLVVPSPRRRAMSLMLAQPPPTHSSDVVEPQQPALSLGSDAG